ncbi:molybdopterin synthase catalytic subunit [Sphingomonas naasensis]|uniref:Molybdopterin synthase catalytic subunit n=1 Tax=Sphingomonas naasensis TaxID=1344951 RepID=A0A4S1WEG8_9SPHN|nr:molybdenum cofactor biosynthesis protein MoaE [Sphingomonas naasensis]NIJ19380.1 molybdopterin synthase catalytic subunit [Sphingomonas naasensis]TGX39126.1 molybdenum cofactor biosynthesis protein MoaE [Sphingomonas naasensis]
MIRVSIDSAPIEVAIELAALEERGAGGLATFTGVVRGDDGVTALELEHYPGMTEQALIALAETACARWSLLAVTMVHRVGVMVPGDRIVFVGTAAQHRREALDACGFLIDRLKTDAPFWKREQLGDAARWVDARARDVDAATRWEAGQ